MPVILHIEKNPEHKEQIGAFMLEASKNGIESSAVENCISLLETSDCIQLAAKKGIDYIKENCAMLNSEIINDLFINMVPEVFR